MSLVESNTRPETSKGHNQKVKRKHLKHVLGNEEPRKSKDTLK